MSAWRQKPKPQVWQRTRWGRTSKTSSAGICVVSGLLLAAVACQGTAFVGGARALATHVGRCAQPGWGSEDLEAARTHRQLKLVACSASGGLDKVRGKTDSPDDLATAIPRSPISDVLGVVEDGEQRQKVAIIGFVVLFWIFILSREVMKFQAALDQGPLATQQFLGIFALKFLAGLAFSALQLYALREFPGPARDKDGPLTWDEVWDEKSEYWKTPVGFTPQVAALAVVASAGTLVAGFKLLSVGIQMVKDVTVQSLPEV